MDKQWIGYDVVSVKSYETSQKMHSAQAYEEWQKVKMHINKRFNEVKQLYSNDSKKQTGRRPSPLDAKYSIFGYSVKLFS